MPKISGEFRLTVLDLNSHFHSRSLVPNSHKIASNWNNSLARINCRFKMASPAPLVCIMCWVRQREFVENFDFNNFFDLSLFTAFTIFDSFSYCPQMPSVWLECLQSPEIRINELVKISFRLAAIWRRHCCASHTATLLNYQIIAFRRRFVQILFRQCPLQRSIEFLRILPGPHEPSLHEINFLQNSIYCAVQFVCSTAAVRSQSEFDRRRPSLF